MPGKHPSRIFEDDGDDSPPDGAPTDSIPPSPPGGYPKPAISDRKLLGMLYEEVMAIRDSVTLLRYRTKMVERLVYGTASLVLVAFATGLVAMVWHHSP